jgi:hypothetical protein
MEMSANYRKLIATTIVVIALATAVAAFVSIRAKTGIPDKQDETTAPSVASAKSHGNEPKNVIIPPKASASADSPDRIQAELITVRPTGFEPSQITRPKGAFVLAVDNRSGLEEIELRLDREDGGREHQVNMRGKKLDWREVVTLNPGSYILREANHSNWACHITITAH